MQIVNKLSCAIVFFFLWAAQPAHAGGGFDWDKVIYGGTFGATVTGEYTEITASPEIGYMFTEYYMAGVGPVYSYYKSSSVQSNMYGGRAFNRFLIGDKFFASAEYVRVYNSTIDLETNNETTSWDHSALVGGGFRYPLGGKSCSGIYASIMFDLLAPNPLSNPVLNVSVVL